VKIVARPVYAGHPRGASAPVVARRRQGLQGLNNVVGVVPVSRHSVPCPGSKPSLRSSTGIGVAVCTARADTDERSRYGGSPGSQSRPPPSSGRGRHSVPSHVLGTSPTGPLLHTLEAAAARRSVLLAVETDEEEHACGGDSYERLLGGADNRRYVTHPIGRLQLSRKNTIPEASHSIPC
jgi:hypothetical protein